MKLPILLTAGALLLVVSSPALAQDSSASHLMINRYIGLPGRGDPPGSEKMPLWGPLDIAIIQTCKNDVQSGRRFPVSKMHNLPQQDVEQLPLGDRPSSNVVQLSARINDCLAERGMGQFSLVPVGPPLETPLLH